MKRQTKIFISTLFSCTFALALFTTTPAYATVGGETLIHTFTYNPADESVYYIKQSYSGRGCPPELIKLSLSSGKTDTVYSCDEGEKAGSTGFGDIITKFKPLTPLSLKDNNIAIDVTFTSAENHSGIDEVARRHFMASVYQNNKKVAEFPIIGCTIAQPFLFQGYSIPGFDKKIALLLSAKGDCFEGGYTNETLHVVGGVDNLNKTQMTNFFKGPSALTPNEGNLLVHESDKVNVITNVDTKDSPTAIVAISIISLLFGFVLGKLIYKKP